LSETRVERALSKGKQLLALLMLESNKSEEKTPLHPLIRPLLSLYEMSFLKIYHPATLPFEALSTKLTSFPVPHSLIRPPIGVIPKRLRNSKGKLMN